jgi:hypothetical protein
VPAHSGGTPILMTLARHAAFGAAAGAAGTTALNAVTYLDMTLRARAASDTPQQTVERLADHTLLEIPGDGEERDNRISGLALLLGTVAGVSAGVVLAAARSRWRLGATGSAVAACGLGMLVGNLPMTMLGVSDPRSWSAEAWAADVLPHLAYGAVTGTVLARLDP